MYNISEARQSYVLSIEKKDYQIQSIGKKWGNVILDVYTKHVA